MIMGDRFLVPKIFNLALAIIVVPFICSGQTSSDKPATPQHVPKVSEKLKKYFGASTGPLKMSVRPLNSSFSRQEPFVFEVTFINVTKAPIFVNLGSHFSFGGFLRTIKKDPLDETFYVMSFAPVGRSDNTVREDFVEIRARGTYKLKVTSNEVHKTGDVESKLLRFHRPSWEERKAGRLKIFLSYATWNQEVFFARQIDGKVNSNTMVLFVK